MVKSTEQLLLFQEEDVAEEVISIPKTRIQLGTLFSGIGAIEQTFLKMGLLHDIVFACDNGEREIVQSREEIDRVLEDVADDEKEAVIRELYLAKGENFMERSYKANYEIAPERFFQDIRFLDGEKYKGEIDIIVGGSPCQAFSCNGKRGGFEDTRGTLFYEYARVIKESQPKCFIYENVKGMITHDHGRTWEGIPQNRLRLYVVGIRKDINIDSPFVFPLPQKLKTTVNDYLLKEQIPAKYYLGRKGFEFVTTHPTRAKVGSPIMNCQKATQQFNWNGDFIFEPLDPQKHAPEILAKAYIGEFKGEQGVIRMFTPRECLRLMGFPDSFKIVVNDNLMWRQAGNSIVVNVLESLMKQLIKTGVFETK